jgi:hypothetical protein
MQSKLEREIMEAFRPDKNTNVMIQAVLDSGLTQSDDCGDSIK